MSKSIVVQNVKVGRSAVSVTFTYIGRNRYRCQVDGRPDIYVGRLAGHSLFQGETQKVDGFVYAKTADVAFSRAVRAFWTP